MILNTVVNTPTFHLEQWLTTIILEEDTEKHKPDPEPLFKYLEATGAKSEECIYIGDMLTDIECANRAGILSGLVQWNGSGVICPEAKLIFRSPHEV